MIIDEPMIMSISRPIKAIHKGSDIEVDTFKFLPPGPQMARGAAQMRKFFSQIQRGFMSFAAQTIGVETIQEQAQLQPGSEIESLHETYSDDEDDKVDDKDKDSKKDKTESPREAKLKQIELDVQSAVEAINVCPELDTYKMTAAFGKMMIANRRCSLKHSDDEVEGALVPLTSYLWESEIFLQDRLAATVRYCCFFGLTSCTVD